MHPRDRDGAGARGRRPRDGRERRRQEVTGFAYKPEEPTTGTVAAEIFVYDPQVLVTVLEELHHELGADAPEEGDSGLGDYGDHLLPRAWSSAARSSPTRSAATGRTWASRTSTSRPTATR